ncbi:hypothetical protein SNE40_009847 [Patella caerulea]|uniref:Uncharacterized protein n=1 Tax=Patella caerulea TaxID=87958 RepID=A0AAN8PS85_PATCE
MVMQKIVGLIQILCLVSASARTINFRELIDYFIHGATVGYHVSFNKCDTNMPTQMPLSSFGDVIDNARVYYAGESDWWIHFSTRRFVNGSTHNIRGPVSRLTEVFFTNGGEADFNIADYDGESGNLLVSGNINCKAERGGIHVTTLTSKGGEIIDLHQVKTSLELGYNVHYHVNILQCGPRPQRFTGTVGWAGRISGHRLNRDGNIEFTQTVELPTATFVMDVTVHHNNNVTVYVDSLVPDSRKSTGVLRKECVLGTDGSFHVFRN